MDFVRPIESIIPGAQGRLLAALARVEGSLTLSALARVSRVSAAQASRVLPALVELGLVHREDVPPAALFRLERKHLVAPLLLRLQQAQPAAISHLTREAGKIEPAPDSAILYGSFAGAGARADSDIDVLMVRPAEVPEDDQRWRAAIQRWVDAARTVTGNAVSILEVDRAEASAKLRSRRSVWRSIADEGIVLAGGSPTELMEAVGA